MLFLFEALFAIGVLSWLLLASGGVVLLVAGWSLIGAVGVWQFRRDARRPPPALRLP